MKKIGDVTVNDGKGLYDNSGLCDTLVNDLNGLLKSIASGQYIQACAIVCGMTQKLKNLKEGIDGEMASKNQIIEELKKINNELVEQQTGLPVDKDGVNNGGN